MYATGQKVARKAIRDVRFLHRITIELGLTHCIMSGGYFQIKVSYETRSVNCDSRALEISTRRDTHCIMSGGYFQIKVSYETRSVKCDSRALEISTRRDTMRQIKLL